MNEEQIKKIIRDTFNENIMNNLDSSIIFKYIEGLEKENQKYKEVINKAIELLGNYKHYSTPDEKQNSDNEDLVNKAFYVLKEVK